MVDIVYPENPWRNKQENAANRESPEDAEEEFGVAIDFGAQKASSDSKDESGSHNRRGCKVTAQCKAKVW